MLADRGDESVNSLPVFRKQKKRGNVRVRFHEEFSGLNIHTGDKNVVSRFFKDLKQYLDARCLSKDVICANCSGCVSVCLYSAARCSSDHQVWTSAQFSDRKSCFHRLRQERAVGNSKRFISFACIVR